MLIEDGVIREVGPTRRLENLAEARNAREISAAGRVVMPGFVDCHTHLLSGPVRAAGPGVGTTARDARMALANVAHVREATARRLAAEAMAALRQCAVCGTTTAEVKTGYALNAGGEIKLLRVLARLAADSIEIVPTFFGAHTAPPEFEGRPGEYIEWLTADLLPVVARRGLATFADGCADAGAFTAAQLRPYFEKARELGFALKLHCAQFGPSDCAALVSEFPFTSIDHLEHAPLELITRAAQASIAVLTPAASFYLGTRPVAARELVEAGAPIALATNYGRAVTPCSSMQHVVFLAAHQLRLTPAEAVSAATINAAHALKIGARTGSLEPGKQADLIILNAGDYRDLACEFGVNLVDVTMKKGAVVHDSSGGKWQKPAL